MWNDLSKHLRSLHQAPQAMQGLHLSHGQEFGDNSSVDLVYAETGP